MEWRYKETKYFRQGTTGSARDLNSVNKVESNGRRDLHHIHMHIYVCAPAPTHVPTHMQSHTHTHTHIHAKLPSDRNKTPWAGRI